MPSNLIKEQKNDSAVSTCCGQSTVWGYDFGKKILWTFAGVLLVYAIFWLGTMVRNNIRQYDYIGLSPKNERMITINGYGKVNSNNDIAVTTIGYSNTDKDVSKAQADNKIVMDQVLAELKTMGVADKDLQSNYTIYPDYNYTQDKGSYYSGNGACYFNSFYNISNYKYGQRINCPLC